MTSEQSQEKDQITANRKGKIESNASNKSVSNQKIDGNSIPSGYNNGREFPSVTLAILCRKYF